MRKDELIELAQAIEFNQSAINYIPELIKAIVLGEETCLKNNKDDLVWLMHAFGKLIAPAIVKQNEAIQSLVCELKEKGVENEN
ncbi:hypothetical protein [Pasteurella multocida]|uniref:hypothetical protein n=1 Tax=Pasteurella multocida TaxID=747 RepID=UPI003978DFC2